MGKPAFIANCIKGKLVDTVSNFVETFNWVARFCYYLKAGGSVEMATTPDDRTTINVAGFNAASDGTVPTKDGNGIRWEQRGGTDTIDVVTGISFDVSSGHVTCAITKRPVRIVANGEQTSSSTSVMTLTPQDFVVDAAYNEDGTHKFNNKMKTAYVFNPDASTTDATIFQTELHECQS